MNEQQTSYGDDPRPIPPSPPEPPSAAGLHAKGHPGPPPDSRQRPRKVAFVLGLFLAVGLLIWLAAALLSNATNQSNAAKQAPEGAAAHAGPAGVIETSVPAQASAPALPRDGVHPRDFVVGDCFKDFKAEALGSTVVACDTDHSAQLVAVYRYPAEDSFPSRDTLKNKTLEACKAVRLTETSNEYVLNFQRTYPSNTSWDRGDRRVDCYITADAGNVIKSSVLP